MLQVLTHNILPVFAILAIGFILGRRKTLSLDEARTVNRIAFLTLQPPLIFALLSSLDFGSVRFGALLIYGLCEVFGFLVGYAVARYLFKRDHLEAWLLGMAVVFVNSLLYIWPISVLIFGEAGALPITAIVALDSSIVFGFFIISTEMIAGKESPLEALKRLTTNPVLIGIFLAVLLNLTGIGVAEPVLTAARFAGAAAAPLTLLALGVILSQQQVRPSAPVVGITAMKLIFFPALVFAALTLLTPDNSWTDRFVLNAAGPSGAMAFSLALLHGVRTDVIAPVVIWTSALSLISLAWLA